jgi:hypothetical protein
MSYTTKIKALEDSYLQLDNQVFQMEKEDNPDKNKIENLREKKTEYLNEIRRLIRLQWEEDHERVHLDDDR